MVNVDSFLRDLRRQRHTEIVYNPYRHLNLTNNLRHYLNFMLNYQGKRILLVGEALGYKGGKLTGIPFSSGNIIQNYNHLLFNSIRDKIKINHIESENTAKIVWDYLLIKTTIPLFWNAFPYHPHPENELHKNRLPNQTELKQGSIYLQQIINLFKPEVIAGVGNKGYKAILQLRPDQQVNKIRHPSFGGKAEFINGMNIIIND